MISRDASGSRSCLQWSRGHVRSRRSLRRARCVRRYRILDDATLGGVVHQRLDGGGDGNLYPAQIAVNDRGFAPRRLRRLRRGRGRRNRIGHDALRKCVRMKERGAATGADGRRFGSYPSRAQLVSMPALPSGQRCCRFRCPSSRSRPRPAAIASCADSRSHGRRFRPAGRPGCGRGMRA